MKLDNLNDVSDLADRLDMLDVQLREASKDDARLMKNRNPHKLAREGYGWQDLVVMCGVTEARARLIVFGPEAHARWKAGQESKAS